MGKNLHLINFRNDQEQECYVFLWALNEAVNQINKYGTQDRKIDFAKYGKIILHGVGKPPLEVLEEMREEYGFEPPETIT
jgi:hypothetical protein